MQQDGPQTPYEVYCNNCRVTFPVGARQCVHCGARLSRDRFHATLELPPGPEEMVLDEAGPSRPGGFSPLTLVWVVLLLGGYLFRSCSQ